MVDYLSLHPRRLRLRVSGTLREVNLELYPETHPLRIIWNVTRFQCGGELRCALQGKGLETTQEECPKDPGVLPPTIIAENQASVVPHHACNGTILVSIEKSNYGDMLPASSGYQKESSKAMNLTRYSTCNVLVFCC